MILLIVLSKLLLFKIIEKLSDIRNHIQIVKSLNRPPSHETDLKLSSKQEKKVNKEVLDFKVF